MRIIENISWNVSHRIYSTLNSLIIGVIVANYLGVEQYGTFIYLLSTLALIAPLSKLGVPAIIAKRVALNSNTNYIETQLSAMTWVLIRGTFLTSVLYLLITYLVLENVNYIALAALLLVAYIFETFGSMAIYVFRGLSNGKEIARIKILATTCSSALRLLFIFSECSLIWFIIAGVVEAVLFINLCYSRLKKSINISLLQGENADAGVELLKKSWPLCLVGVMDVIYIKSDIVLLGFLTDFSSVGTYSIAAKVNIFITSLITVFGWSIQPKITEISKLSKSKQLKFLRKLNIYTVIMISIIIVPVYNLAPTIVEHLFNEQFAGSVVIIKILLFTNVFYGLMIIRDYWLVAMDLNFWRLVPSMIGVLSNACLNLLLIPTFGAEGAAYATLISIVLSAVISNFILPQKYRWFVFSQIRLM